MKNKLFNFWLNSFT